MPTGNEIHRTLREAIHHTYANHPEKKPLAANLDWSPSELSQRTTLGTEGRPFPADDPGERLVILMRETGDYSYLATLAEKCGFEMHEKRDHLPEILAKIQATQQELARQFQQLELTVPLSALAGKKGR